MQVRMTPAMLATLPQVAAKSNIVVTMQLNQLLDLTTRCREGPFGLSAHVRRQGTLASDTIRYSQVCLPSQIRRYGHAVSPNGTPPTGFDPSEYSQIHCHRIPIVMMDERFSFAG